MEIADDQNRLRKPTPSLSTANASPAMTDDTILPLSFSAVHTKKITATFDGGRLSSNGGVMLLAIAKRRLGLADLPGWSWIGAIRRGLCTTVSYVSRLLELPPSAG